MALPIQPPDGWRRRRAVTNMPYGLNEGDMWLGVDSDVGKLLLERDGLTLVHEMLFKDGELQDCMYVTDNIELINQAREGHQRWLADAVRRTAVAN